MICKNRQFILEQSNNIYNDILLPLKERSRDNNQSCIYFYRLIGFNNQTEYMNWTTSLHKKLVSLGNLYLYFIENIPLPYNKPLTAKLNNTLSTINSTQADILFQALEAANLFPMPAALIQDPFKTVLELYLKNEQSINISTVKNFVSKLILWLHEYIPQIYQTNSPWNPKILYYGDIKKHPVYFLILLSQIGCDVLYINPHSDSGYPKVDKDSRFSKLVEGNIKKRLSDPPIKVLPKPEHPLNIEQLNKVVPNTGPTAVIKLINSNDIFNDILLPLNKRSGYLGSPTPILPVYFYRYIGIGDTAIDEYCNKLYHLDKALKNQPNGFIRFTGHIAIPEKNEVDTYKTTLQQTEATLLYGSEKDILVNKVINADILPNTINQPLNNTIKTAFKETIDLFDKLEPINNISKLENFALKLIGWINKHFKYLYKLFTIIDNPKILYYGDIKKHEVYLLIYFSQIGSDVLYINPDQQADNIFKKIDREEKYTKLIQYEHSEVLKEFPTYERVVRKATVAYNAAQEIQQVIYNEDVGLFKPWQFENSLTKPVTLKTTYDELKILWPEEARIRPEFKIVEGTVYVPNLFAKIKGTHKELSQYWHDYKQLATAKNTHVITKIPFTAISYSKQDLYLAAFLLDNSGQVDKEKLLNSNFYQYNYLRNSLQEFIINKINELINADVFVNKIDHELKIKIIMTILTMDENILRLIETFDFPGEVPKLIIYDGTKDVFSDEDAIIIAFLNLAGIDIAIFTPTNYNNIELKLKASLLDIHQLPAVQLDLKAPDPSDLLAEENKLSTLFNNLSQKIRGKFH